MKRLEFQIAVDNTLENVHFRIGRYIAYKAYYVQKSKSCVAGKIKLLTMGNFYKLH